MYQRMGAIAYKANLDNTVKLANHLEQPQLGFKSVHVAGTNGKGSTSHMLASILQEAGYKVGLYTSPHLKDFRERIKIDGKMISKAYVKTFIENHKTFFEENKLSFFEMTVGLAFKYFKDQAVDIAIVEVGMGGRLDSTNIIKPEVSVITNIGLDHTKFLGATLPEIAVEKAGIIKKMVPVVIGETQNETKPVFVEKASSENCEIVFANTLKLGTYETDLKGNYQKKNVKTALAVIEVLQKKHWKISEENIKNGLLNTVKNTGLMGRWQCLSQNPRIVCDTAHNREGLSIVIDQLLKEDFKKLHIILGVVNDKDLDSILPLFPHDAEYYFCKPDVPRGLDAKILANAADELGLKGEVFNSVKEALESAEIAADKRDLIFIGGSTFVVAEVI